MDELQMSVSGAGGGEPFGGQRAAVGEARSQNGKPDGALQIASLKKRGYGFC
jgi:hypothetical protein